MLKVRICVRSFVGARNTQHFLHRLNAPKTIPAGFTKIGFQPDDSLAIRRWYASQVILFTSAECTPLFGLALRLRGKPLNLVLPFYVAGAVLLLLLWPRQIPTQARFDT